MYKNVYGYWAGCGVYVFLYEVLCGVLQGCALSSLLFNYCIDPLLWPFAELVVAPGLGHVLACADDITAAISRLQLCYVQAHRGCHLNAKKCILVLTRTKATPRVVEAVSRWISSSVHDLDGVSVTNCGNYLGVHSACTHRKIRPGWKLFALVGNQTVRV